MIIGIDGNEANLKQRVGVGQYAFNLLTELSKLKNNNIYHIYLKNSPLPDMPLESKNWHYHVFGPNKLWTRLALPLHLYIDRLKLDYFYSPSHYSPVFSPFPTIPTIHDLGYLDNLDQFTKKDAHQLVHWTKQSLKNAKKIMAVSEFTKSELIRIYNIDPNKIAVVPNGVGKPILENNFQPVLNKFNITKPYFLCIGTLKPNKNIPFLITAFAKYIKNRVTLKLKLVIAGKKGWLFDDIFSTVKKEGIEDSIIFTDYISEKEKWELIQNTLATVIPSTYEGFGIPAIESQKLGTPVIASNIPVFKEVLENTALLVDPYDQKTLIKAFDDIQNPRKRSELIKLGLKQSSKYTWVNSAKMFVEALNNI